MWLRVNRYYQSYSNTPRYYTIMGDPKVPERMCLRIFPYPDIDRTLDFVYKRKPRPLAIDQYTTGKVSVDAVNSPQTITGTGTAFTAQMVGSVIRLAGSYSIQNGQPVLPSNLAGASPAVLERNITLFNSATNLSVDDAATQSLTNVAFRVSDPIDVDDQVMMEAFFRCCEKHYAMERRMKDRVEVAQIYLDQLRRAKEADSRVFAQRTAGVGGPFRQRMARMPSGPDIP